MNRKTSWPCLDGKPWSAPKTFSYVPAITRAALESPRAIAGASIFALAVACRDRLACRRGGLGEGGGRGFLFADPNGSEGRLARPDRLAQAGRARTCCTARSCSAGES